MARRYTHKDRQTDRQMDIQTDRQIQIEKERDWGGGDQAFCWKLTQNK